jgi:hypothetical protein
MLFDVMRDFVDIEWQRRHRRFYGETIRIIQQTALSAG